MRQLLPLLFVVLLAPSAALADELTVLTPAVVTPPLRKLAESWSQTSGIKVNFRQGNVGQTVARVGTMPADIIVLPPDTMTQVTAKVKPASLVKLPFAKFALAGKKGVPHPDISTVEKFAAYLRASTGIQYNTPEDGSASGIAIAAMLKRQEFQGVIGRPIHDMPGPAVDKGEAELGGGAISEENFSDGAEVIGMFPETLKMQLDFSGGVLDASVQSDKAASFLAYITAPAARPVWQASGFTLP